MTELEERPQTRDVVVFHDVRSRTERRLVHEWADLNHPTATVVSLHDEWSAHEVPDSTLLVPVRITWAATSRRTADMLANLAPRRPWAAVQPVLARQAPSSINVVVGEPATLGTLRHLHHTGHDDGGSLEEFVAHSAVLAVDRAERRLVGDRYKVPRRMAEQIAGSAPLRSKVSELADSTGRPVDELRAEIRTHLNDLVAVQSPAAIDAYRAVLAPMHARAWKVHVNEDRFPHLRELNKRNALVFLPAHRSYSDPLVLGEVLHAHDFPRNHILGGNNMAIWPIGPLGKRAGVVFIRRITGDNPGYKLALREYLAHLAAKRFNLEWYIEGGRTRTGKLRPPKLGLLSYLTRALDDGRTDDVQLVPVSIAYDHLHEVAALSEEQGGGTKAAEGVRWLARYVLGQSAHRGNAWVEFGEPFSLRQALDDAGEGKARLEKVAFRICDGINKTTPITPTALVTLALLGARDRALTLAEVRRVVLPLLDYLARRGQEGPAAGLRSDRVLAQTLDQLVEVGVATRFSGGPKPVWVVRPGQHRVAAFYRNGAVHHLLIRALVELVLLDLAARESTANPIEAAWSEALRLRDLLKFEFFFPPTAQFREEVEAELELIDPEWFVHTRTEAGAMRLLTNSQVLVAHRALRSFFDAQLVVSEALSSKDPGVGIDDKEFLLECLGLGQQLWLRGRLHRADSVSSELYATALRLVRHRGLVTADAEAAAKARSEFDDSLQSVMSRLTVIAELEDGLLTEEVSP